MTALRERPTMEATQVPMRSHVTEWVLGIVGMVAAAVGAYMYLAPADWFLGGLVEGWYFAMFIGAGLLLTSAFGIFARKEFLEDRHWTARVTVPAVLALLALGGAITFALIWII